MAFESIDVSSLKNSLNNCKSSINYSITNRLIGDLDASQAWICEAELKLQNSFGKLTDERYKQLEKLLDDYLIITGYIEEYKMLEKENEDLQQKYSMLNDKLYYTDYYNETTTDDDGNPVTTLKSRVLKDYNVENQMNNTSYNININKEKMENLKNKVSNSI